MPYGAVRDCLPPGHPQRARVLHWWLAFMLAWILSVAAGIAAPMVQVGRAVKATWDIHRADRNFARFHGLDEDLGLAV